MFEPASLDDLRKLAKNDERRSDPHKVIKLPCCNTAVELTKTGDQIIVCPNCRKRSVVTWSLNPKISTQGRDF